MRINKEPIRPAHVSSCYWACDVHQHHPVMFTAVSFVAPSSLPCASQLASGLDFLHKNCIAHRDFKSGNIFITGEETAMNWGRGHLASLTPKGLVLSLLFSTWGWREIRKVSLTIHLNPSSQPPNVSLSCLSQTLPFITPSISHRFTPDPPLPHHALTALIPTASNPQPLNPLALAPPLPYRSLCHVFAPFLPLIPSSLLQINVCLNP